MRKYILILLISIAAVAPWFVFKNKHSLHTLKIRVIKKEDLNKLIGEAVALLKNRKDKDALVIFDKILRNEPDNLDALSGKAEVLRRMGKFKEAQEIISEILKMNPQHPSALITLAYIKYKDAQLGEAQELINKVLKDNYLDKENEALAYTVLGVINSRRSMQGWFLSKMQYASQVKAYFLKAKALAPRLPEAHLSLGTFYLLAPAIVGGNLDKALQELEVAVKIAPDFATVNARLAQAYKKKGDLENYNFYIQRVQELDPNNEVLKEIKNEKFKN